jgi:hypothetical protein
MLYVAGPNVCLAHNKIYIVRLYISGAHHFFSPSGFYVFSYPTLCDASSLLGSPAMAPGKDDYEK